MSKDERDLEQVFRIDSGNSFVEVMLTGLPYDKLLLNFKQYDKTQAAGNRTTGEIGIFMGIYEAQRLSRDIMSGRIATLGKMEIDKAKKANLKYAGAVFTSQGGTSARRRPDGIAIARVFTLSPGARQPWVLCAKQGKAHETPEGLIVMDGQPEVTIRVALSNEKLKELALSIETVVRTWEQLRFVPVAAPMMRIAQERRQEAIDKAKAASSASS